MFKQIQDVRIGDRIVEGKSAIKVTDKHNPAHDPGRYGHGHVIINNQLRYEPETIVEVR